MTEGAQEGQEEAQLGGRQVPGTPDRPETLQRPCGSTQDDISQGDRPSSDGEDSPLGTAGRGADLVARKEREREEYRAVKKSKLDEIFERELLAKSFEPTLTAGPSIREEYS